MNEDVDAAELFHRLIDQTLQVLQLRDVGAHGQGAAAHAPHLLGDGLALLQRPAGGHDMGAKMAQSQRHGLAQAVPSAGDDDHLVLNTPCGVLKANDLFHVNLLCHSGVCLQTRQSPVGQAFQPAAALTGWKACPTSHATACPEHSASACYTRIG